MGILEDLSGRRPDGVLSLSLSVPVGPRCVEMMSESASIWAKRHCHFPFVLFVNIDPYSVSSPGPSIMICLPFFGFWRFFDSFTVHMFGSIVCGEYQSFIVCYFNLNSRSEFMDLLES